jgi:outer membrane lipoprotein LolB
VNVRLAACAGLLLASGCATVPREVPVDWPERRALLQSLDRWTMDGRIAVAAGEEGFSGGFDWAQQGTVADIELSGPVGGPAMAIRIQGDKVVVSVRGTAYEDDEARRYIAERFGPGRSLPIHEMRYWLVGAPAPDAPHEESLGADGLLAGLTQSGWQVRYDRYEPVGAIALPARLEMTSEGMRLRVAVSDWQIGP